MNGILLNQKSPTIEVPYSIDSDGTVIFDSINASEIYGGGVLLSEIYAPKSHASSATTYGVGTSSSYGHLRISNSVTSTSSNTALSLTGANTLNNKITNLQEKIEAIQDDMIYVGHYTATLTWVVSSPAAVDITTDDDEYKTCRFTGTLDIELTIYNDDTGTIVNSQSCSSVYEITAINENSLYEEGFSLLFDYDVSSNAATVKIVPALRLDDLASDFTVSQVKKAINQSEDLVISNCFFGTSTTYGLVTSVTYSNNSITSSSDSSSLADKIAELEARIEALES